MFNSDLRSRLSFFLLGLWTLVPVVMLAGASSTGGLMPCPRKRNGPMVVWR